MGMLESKPKDYSDGRTKQAFKDQCDINKMLKKAAKVGSIAHLEKYPEKVYGEFDGEFTLLDARLVMGRAQEIFDDLPSQTRKDFNNDPLAYVQWAGKPENNDKLRDLLPEIAKPGDYFPNPVKRGGQGAGAATAPEDGGNAAPSSETPASPPAGGDPQAASAPEGGTD